MKYRCVVIDPPWPERGAGKVKRGADRHYSLMPVHEIEAVLSDEILPLLDDDCHLWLWVTNNYLRGGLWILDVLDFRYVTNLVWVKDRIGLGQYLRGQHELCLFSVRGKTMMPEVRNVASVIFCPKGEHSQKPEVFARTKRPGWDAWGDQVQDTLLTL